MKIKTLASETSQESIWEKQIAQDGQDLVQVKIRSTSGFYDDVVVSFTDDGKSINLQALNGSKKNVLPIITQ